MSQLIRFGIASDKPVGSDDACDTNTDGRECCSAGASRRHNTLPTCLHNLNRMASVSFPFKVNHNQCGPTGLAATRVVEQGTHGTRCQARSVAMHTPAEATFPSPSHRPAVRPRCRCKWRSGTPSAGSASVRARQCLLPIFPHKFISLGNISNILRYLYEKNTHVKRDYPI